MVTDEADANSIQPLFSEEEIYDFISTFYYRQYSLFTHSSKTLYKILMLKIKTPIYNGFYFVQTFLKTRFSSTGTHNILHKTIYSTKWSKYKSLFPYVSRWGILFLSRKTSPAATSG